MSPERQAQLEALEKSLAPFFAEARDAAFKNGQDSGYRLAIYDMEREVADIVTRGKMEEKRELAGALAKAAGWLRDLQNTTPIT